MKSTDVENTCHERMARGHREFRVARNNNYTVNSVLEGRNPVRNELSARVRRTRIAEGLSTIELTCFERSVASVVGDAQLVAIDELLCTSMRRTTCTYLGQSRVREGDVDPRDLEELRSLSLLLGSLLVRRDGRPVMRDLSSGRDQGDEQLEPLPKRSDVVVDLEEDIVLDPLGQTQTDPTRKDRGQRR